MLQPDVQHTAHFPAPAEKTVKGTNSPHARYPKILEIGPIPPPHAGWGVRCEYLIRALRERGIETAALDLGPNRRIRRDHCDDVQSGWDYAWKVLRYLLRGYRVHAHLNGESVKAYLLVLYSTVMSRIVRRPAALTWHGGLGYRYFPDNGNRVARIVHRMIFGMCETIVCNDELIKEHIVAYGVPADKVVPIPAFSRQYLEFEPATLPAAVEQFTESRSPLLFCYTYFRPEFYMPVLVQALTRLVQTYPSLGIVLVGYAREAEATRRQVNELGLQDHVLFCGDLDRNAFLTLLKRADLYVRTHKRDGISSSVLEALALGVPVVAAENALRPPEVTTYAADDADNLARAVDDVLSPRAERPADTVLELEDTVAREVDLLTEGLEAGKSRPQLTP